MRNTKYATINPTMPVMVIRLGATHFGSSSVMPTLKLRLSFLSHKSSLISPSRGAYYNISLCLEDIHTVPEGLVQVIYPCISARLVLVLLQALQTSGCRIRHGLLALFSLRLDKRIACLQCGRISKANQDHSIISYVPS